MSNLGSLSLDRCVKFCVLSRGPGDWFFIRSIDFLSLYRLFMVETKLERESEETLDLSIEARSVNTSADLISSSGS